MLVGTCARLSSRQRWQSAFAKTRSRHSLSMVLWLLGAAGKFVDNLEGGGGDEDEDDKREQSLSAEESSAETLRSRSLASVKVFKNSSRRSTKVAFPKGTGRRTYALEIGTP
jgi:hypothetical protein